MGGEAAGADALRAAVRERAERRVDVVKIMASGGVNTAGSDAAAPQFGVDDLRVVVDEAHRLGLPVTAHAHSVGSVRDAHRRGRGRDRARVVRDRDRVRAGPDGGGGPGRPPDPGLPDAGLRPRRDAAAGGPRDDAAHRHDAGESGGDVRRPAPRRGRCSWPARTPASTRASGTACCPRHWCSSRRPGSPVADVLASATSVAADALGLGDRTGRLRARARRRPARRARRPGRRHDPCVRDVVAVAVRGRRVV